LIEQIEAHAKRLHVRAHLWRKGRLRVLGEFEENHIMMDKEWG
jgi:hypothetical protein